MPSPTRPSSAMASTSRTSRSGGIDYSKWDNLDVSDSDEEHGDINKLETQFAQISGTDAASDPGLIKDGSVEGGLRVEEKNVKEQHYLHKMKIFQKQYKSQHCAPDNKSSLTLDQMFDLYGTKCILAVAPSYKSGINPNFFEEYFSDLELSDFTNTAQCKTAIWNEYQQRRYSYCKHLAGYHKGITQKCNRELGKVEFWRRFHMQSQPPPSIVEWYFDNRRKIGDVRPTVGYVATKYLEGISDVLYQSFSNCPVSPKQTLAFGTVHVAVGFVDLGLLLDSQFLEPELKNTPASLLFRGFEASSFAVAKSLVLWEMLCTTGMKARWVVQIWFSTIWSKRATNAFLAAARRVATAECSKDTVDQNPTVCVLVLHWSCSKGVGLKKLVQRRSSIRKESSPALFFALKEDRQEMIRYHLTGAFGLSGEEQCSGSVLMFDCPPAVVKHEAASVFETMTLDDVVSSELYNGSYLQTAEKVKEARVSVLLSHAQSGRIKVKLSVSVLNLKSPVLEEIIHLQPHSISWSNILDYMSPGKFHVLAKTCSAIAIHSGYSMNWPTVIYGTSLIDYPETSLQVISEAEVATAASLRNMCRGRQIFLTPIQHNPLNVTASLLAKRCHSHWLKYFFGVGNVRFFEAGMLENHHNPLSRVSVVVSSSWDYQYQK